MSKRTVLIIFIRCAILVCACIPLTVRIVAAEQPGTPVSTLQTSSDADDDDQYCDSSEIGSPYIPVDSWIYPAVFRLYSLGYVDTVYLNMRPWTRAAVKNMLDEASDHLEDADPGPVTNEAEGIIDSLTHELRFDNVDPCKGGKGIARIESVYSVARGISGTPLRDSYHLGSSIINDYGRPYENGFNNYSGASGYASAGRFLIYVRGEFRGAPSAAGYSSALVSTLSAQDDTTNYFTQSCWLNDTPCTPMPDSLQTTMPVGPIALTTNVRLLEAYVSAQYLHHVISFGKQDDWLGPGLGGGMAYSNNAENPYTFRINRIEPLHVPLLSLLTGPFRYEFLVGPLKGHTYPRDPWVHVEKVSFRPTENLEFGFERTVIWGGQGHEPITVKSFLRSFFSLSAPTVNAVKAGPTDPGARFGAFDFSYKLPFVRNWLTLYADSEVHDDISPIDAPRRAAWRPGLYLSHVPGIPKLDMRVEGVSTDPNLVDINGNRYAGHFMYYEAVQKQGYTNAGQIFGDWIGREGKGGQGWLTYHLSGDESIQIGLRNQKVAKDFIQGGTTLDEIDFQAVKRIGRDFEINGKFAFEHWKAPIYLPGQQTVTATTIQLTWFPGRNVSF
jgi:hypothetical protein